MKLQTAPSGDASPQLHPGFRIDALTWLLLLVLAVVITLAYGRLAAASFVDLDDAVYVFENPHVTDGLTPGDIRWAVTTRNGGFWIPLTWISLQLDATLSGPPPQPVSTVAPLPSAAVYHIDNLVLHFLGSSLLFLFLYRLTNRRAASFAVALLWAMHPLRVESVAWVTERKDVLSGAFGFLTMYLYVVARQRPRWIWPLAVFLAMGASLMAKPTLVTLPCIFILLDWWPLDLVHNARDLLRSALRKWPLFLVALVDSAGTALAQRRIGTLNLGPLERIAHGLISYARYLWMQVDFRGFAPHHPYTGSPPLLALGAFALLAAITALCFWQRKSRPWLLLGWLWYLGVQFPLVGAINSGLQDYAERFTYIPAVGLFIMAVFSIPERWFADRPQRIAVATALAAAACALGAFTVRQAAYWQDSVTLFEHTSAVTPPNSVVPLGLGMAYLRAGRFDDAIAQYQKVTDPSPRSASPEVMIATAYMLKGNLTLAIGHARQAVFVQPQSPLAHQVLGVAFARAGYYREAAAEFEKVLALNPGDPQAAAQLQAAREARPAH